MWENGNLHCVGKLVKSIDEHHLTIPIKISIDPAIPLPGLFLKEILFVCPTRLIVQVCIHASKNARHNIVYRAEKKINLKEPDLLSIGRKIVK